MSGDFLGKIEIQVLCRMKQVFKMLNTIASWAFALFVCFCAYLLHSEVLAMWATAAAVMNSLQITDRLGGVDVILCAAPQGWWREILSVLFVIFIALCLYRNIIRKGVYALVLSGLSLMLCGAFRCVKYIAESELLFNGAVAPGHLWSADSVSCFIFVVYGLAIAREIRLIAKGPPPHYAGNPPGFDSDFEQAASHEKSCQETGGKG